MTDCAKNRFHTEKHRDSLVVAAQVKPCNANLTSSLSSAENTITSTMTSSVVACVCTCNSCTPLCRGSFLPTTSNNFQGEEPHYDEGTTAANGKPMMLIPREVILLSTSNILDENSGAIKRMQSTTSASSSQQSVPVLDTSQITDEVQSKDDDDASLTSSASSSHHRVVFDHPDEMMVPLNFSQPGDYASFGHGDVTKGQEKKHFWSSFASFRMQYLIVHTAIMLADGLQGTHLYVLYEGYGYSVASLYSLGFVAGAITSPFIGPVVDKIGRKKAAMVYCILEMLINYMELFPVFLGLIVSRMIGGITTNLLFSVFESWLVSEHRSRGFSEDKLEIILRDSTIVSNSAAILSGYLAHCLADNFGAVGPFQGAVALTFGALVLVGCLWTENYGKGNYASELMTWKGNMVEAFQTIVHDSKITRVGLIQGMTEGSLQTFVFLWSPALRTFAASAPAGTLGMDKNGEPAYGLIFGAFMACGVLGGFTESTLRSLVARVTTRTNQDASSENSSSVETTDPGTRESKPSSVDFTCTLCYLVAAALLLTPVMVNKDSPYAFSICVGAFMCYELMVGLYMPCEGVIRSIYMPNESICSLMTMLRVIVNVAVAVGVVSTNYVPFTSAFSALSMMLMVAAMLQLSLVPRDELWQVVKKFAFMPLGTESNAKLKDE